jgi:hypothetical protein
LEEDWEVQSSIRKSNLQWLIWDQVEECASNLRNTAIDIPNNPNKDCLDDLQELMDRRSLLHRTDGNGKGKDRCVSESERSKERDRGKGPAGCGMHHTNRSNMVRYVWAKLCVHSKR